MGKKMVITVDIETGKIDSVTDENGTPATNGRVSKDSPIRDATITDVNTGTFVSTKTNPTCFWWFFLGEWWYICF